MWDLVRIRHREGKHLDKEDEGDLFVRGRLTKRRGFESKPSKGNENGLRKKG